MKDHEKKARTIRDQLREFEQKLEIDEFDLGPSLREQAGLYYHVAREHAEATARVDTIKLDIKQLHAKLDKDIRTEAAKGDKKLTESAVGNQIRDDSDMRDLEQDLLAATRDASLWGALREGYQQRSYMLRQLVDLAVREAWEQGEADRSDRKVRKVVNAEYENARRKSIARRGEDVRDRRSRRNDADAAHDRD